MKSPWSARPRPARVVGSPEVCQYLVDRPLDKGGEYRMAEDAIPNRHQCGSLKAAESRILTDLLFLGVDDEGWRTPLYDDNVLPVHSPTTAMRSTALIRGRLEPMGSGQWPVRDGAAMMATHACLAAAVKRSLLLGDLLDLRCLLVAP